MGWFERLHGTIGGGRHDIFDEEMRFHVEARTEEYIRRGMSQADARREALRRFGNSTLVREVRPTNA